jgi:hypothetical protein
MHREAQYAGELARVTADKEIKGTLSSYTGATVLSALPPGRNGSTELCS